MDYQYKILISKSKIQDKVINRTNNEINNGITIIIGFTADEEGTFNNTITVGSDETSTTFTVKATANLESPPTPPAVLGDSIVEDWEGCTSGGYWTDVVVGNTFVWEFTDAGIWGDNLRHGELSCRMGKSGNSVIAMGEDIEGGTSAIAFWAGCFGSDADASLRLDYSTNGGSTWTTLGNVTTTKGVLQRYQLAADVANTVRFRIVQTSGMRVNIDDITLYARVQQEPEPSCDVNGDGEVNIADINAVIDAILSNEGNSACDVNGDGEVNIADVNTVINDILGS